jgi:hypothetical protein
MADNTYSPAEDLMRNLQREMGLLNAEYLVGSGSRQGLRAVDQSPKVNMKIEEQAGEPPRITSTFSNETPSPNPADFAFDPMEFWSGISSVVDAEFSTGGNTHNIPRMSYGSPEDYGVTQQVQDRSGVPSIPRDYDNIYGRSTDYGVSPTTQYYPPGAMQQLSHMPNQMGIDPTSLAMQNMPYDLTGTLPNAFEGDPPPPTAYGSPPLSGGLQEPLANYPPPGYPSSEPTAEAYNTPPPLPNTMMPGFEPTLSSAEGGMDARASQVKDDWNATMEQAVSAGVVDQDTVNKTSAATVSAINEPAVPLSNNVNGQDASQNPIMSGQIFDPRQRQAEYLKQMNTIMMGGLMLDLAAAALGVKSRSGSYMDGQLKILEQTMKFDDQARIYEATKSVYYPDGVYQNPGTQADVFDSLMGTGMVTPAEASAISGYHPEGSSGYDTHYSVELSEDGTSVIKPVYVPKGTIPPEGTFPNATVAQYEAERLSGGSGTSAGKNFSQWKELSAAVAEAEAAGDPARAKKAKAELDAFERINKMVGIGGEPTFGNALNAYDSQFKAMQNAATEDGMSPENTFRKRVDPNDPKSELVYIPWGQFQTDWLRNWSLNVVTKNANGNDVDVVIPGWLQISAPWRTEELPTTKRVASPSKILELQEIIEDGGITVKGEFVTVEQVKKEWNETFTVPWNQVLGQGQ